MHQTRQIATASLLLGSTVAFWDWAYGGLSLRYRLTDHRRAPRRAALAARPPQSGDTVLLGDSLTQRGDWSRLRLGSPVRNFGLDWDHTEQVLARLGPITAAKPAAISLLIGTNDTGAGRSVADVVKGIVAVIDQIRDASPETQLVVHTLPPRNDRWRQTIPQVNEQIRRVANARDLAVIDLWAMFADDAGGLPDDLAADKVHLRPAAYQRWTDALRGELLAGR